MFTGGWSKASGARISSEFARVSRLLPGARAGLVWMGGRPARAPGAKGTWVLSAATQCALVFATLISMLHLMSGLFRIGCAPATRATPNFRPLATCWADHGSVCATPRGAGASSVRLRTEGVDDGVNSPVRMSFVLLHRLHVLNTLAPRLPGIRFSLPATVHLPSPS